MDGLGDGEGASGVGVLLWIVCEGDKTIDGAVIGGMAVEASGVVEGYHTFQKAFQRTFLDIKKENLALETLPPE